MTQILKKIIKERGQRPDHHVDKPKGKRGRRYLVFLLEGNCIPEEVLDNTTISGGPCILYVSRVFTSGVFCGVTNVGILVSCPSRIACWKALAKAVTEAKRSS